MGNRSKSKVNKQILADEIEVNLNFEDNCVS